MRAFTLWELLVAMIITGVIIDLGYIVYLKAEKNLLRDQKEKINLFDAILFEKSLREAAESADYIFQEGGQLVLFKDDNETTLEFIDSLMTIRNDFTGISDSMKVTYLKTSCVDSIPDLVSTIQYGIALHFDTINIVIRKVYSNKSLYDYFIQ